MPAYNFQKRFAPLVKSGNKRQTIRAKRKDGRVPKVGDFLFLYTGMRTKKCRKLRNAVCSQVFPIVIGPYGVDLNGYPMTICAMQNLARDDGFKDWIEMSDWFAKTHGLPFHGFLIKW